jgi:hypothetical protein
MTSKWPTRIMTLIALLPWTLSESAAQGAFPPNDIEGSSAGKGSGHSAGVRPLRLRVTNYLVF